MNVDALQALLAKVQSGETASALVVPIARHRTAPPGSTSATLRRGRGATEARGYFWLWA